MVVVVLVFNGGGCVGDGLQWCSVVVVVLNGGGCGDESDGGVQWWLL